MLQQDVSGGEKGVARAGSTGLGIAADAARARCARGLGTSTPRSIEMECLAAGARRPAAVPARLTGSA